MRKKRDISIGILRFFAALLITNSHIAVLYPDNLTLPRNLPWQFALLSWRKYINSIKELFPLNLFIFLISVLIAVYTLRCIARVWSQTFKDDNYNWSAVFKPYRP